MKNFLAGVLVISVASIALSQAPTPKPATALAVVQKWEYKVVEMGMGSLDTSEKNLNNMAKEGWELDHVVADHIAIFRRIVKQ